MIDRWTSGRGRTGGIRRFGLTIATSLGIAAAAGSAATAAPSLKAVPIGTFSNPVYVVGSPDNSRVLFVVERGGQVRVMVDEIKRTVPFLDIRNLVRGSPDPGAGGEEGLLSVAFPPNYAQTRRFYVFFTNNNGNLEIDEFRRSPTNALRADPASRRVVFLISHPEAENHNGGQLQFGPEGLLYISIGDGGRAPPGNLARNINSFLGKILRINPLASGGSRYSVPASNPFVGLPGRDEVFAYGLRNPWRFAFDGGRLIIGDVGQMQREEVDFLTLAAAKGANFGWPQFEGELPFDATRPGSHPAKPPMFAYSHDSGGCAIIGGYVIHDPRIPALANRYLYSDSCTGDLRTFIPNVGAQTAGDDKSTELILPGISSLGRGANGRLYAAQLSGPVLRLDPP